MIMISRAAVFGVSLTSIAAHAEDKGMPVHLQDLLDRGFAVIAEGKLVTETICSRQMLIVLPRRDPREDDSCRTHYGSFKRVKNEDQEFVCVSFPDWACHQSSSMN